MGEERMKTKQRPLTGKQAKFVENYVTNGNNASKAARDAGYKGNINTIKAVASQNLAKTYLMDAIRAKEAEIAQECHITRDEVLKGIKELMNSKHDSVKARALELGGKTLAMFTDVHKDQTDDRPKRSTGDQAVIDDLVAEYKRRSSIRAVV